MQIKIPELTKCCYCVPPRYGLLIFGYIKLATALTGLVLLQLALEFIPLETITTIVIFVDIVFSVVLIIASHEKKTNLLTVYYYYGITESIVCALLVALIVAVGVSWTSHHDHKMHVSGIFMLVSSGIIIVHIAVEVYIVLLIRSQQAKLLDISESTNSTAEAGRGSAITTDRPRMSERDSKY